MASVLTNFECSGLFGLAIHDWSNKDKADKTYANFVPHFNNVVLNAVANSPCVLPASKAMLAL
jgi:hypothetical protein